MDKFSELKAVAEKAKELAGINNYKKGKDAIVAFKAAANPAAILALLAERDSNQQNYQNAMEELRIERAQRQAADQRIAELEAKLATPVRLQSPWVDKVGNRWLLEGTTADVIRAAGFAVTVEGDE
ncbi:hypothetical protein JY554_02630 [Serratia marcescens]|nr:hypothetical protein [Serratia marcescens]